MENLENKITIKEIEESLPTNLVVVKPYIKYSVKRAIKNEILDLCIIKDGSKTRIDYAFSNILLDTLLIQNCTNISLVGETTDSIYDQYDKLKELGIIEYIKSKINKEDLLELETIIEKELDQEVKISNSLESIVSDFLEKIINKIPSTLDIENLAKNLGTELKDLDLSKLTEVNKIKDLLENKVNIGN